MTTEAAAAQELTAEAPATEASGTGIPKWCVDTSVLLRAALGDSPAAAAWLAERRKRREPLIGSKLLDTEARRVVLNRTLAGALDGEIDLDGHLGVFHMVRLDNDLADEAAAIKQPLRAADAIHLASALRLGAGEVAVVTHDAQMATAAANLGFAVVDPVTDDPRCAAVA